MLLAWSVTEVIRYSYFAFTLASAALAAGSSGSMAEEKSGILLQLLTWLRYSTFFVLYPVGILSEWWLVYNAATGPAGPEVGRWYEYLMIVVLVAYLPGRSSSLSTTLLEYTSGTQG